MNPTLQKFLYTAGAGALLGLTAVPQVAPFAPFITPIAAALLGMAHGKRPGDVTAAEVAELKAALAKYKAAGQ